MRAVTRWPWLAHIEIDPIGADAEGLDELGDGRGERRVVLLVDAADAADDAERAWCLLAGPDHGRLIMHTHGDLRNPSEQARAVGTVHWWAALVSTVVDWAGWWARLAGT